MKKLFTLILGMLFCVAANAQWQNGGTVVFSPVKANKAFKKAPTAKTFTYDTGSGMNALGVGKAETYDLAIYIPERFAGKRIEMMGFPLYSKSCLTDVKAWVAAGFPDNVDDAPICINVTEPKDIASDEDLTVVPIEDEFIVPAGGCLVGYSFTVTSVASEPGKYPMIYDTGDGVDGGFFARTSTSVSQWSSLSDYGNLCIYVTLSGEFPDNNVDAELYHSPSCAKANGKFEAQVALLNNGITKVSSVELVVKDVTNGITFPAKTYNVDIAVDQTDLLNLEIATPEALTLQQQFAVTVTKVNGVDNISERNSFEFSLANAQEVADAYVVEEEFTGTACGWCPRGITGIQMANETFGDRFIPIAIHNYSTADPMYLSAYNAFANKTFPGAPSCVLNRGNVMDPYYGISSNDFGIGEEIDRIIYEGTYAKVGVKAEWADTDSLVINVHSAHEFYAPSEMPNYGVAYVLVADSLATPSTATTTAQKNKWKQSNYYYQYKADPDQVGVDLAPWTQKGTSFVTPFYHVAIAVKDIATGNKAVVTAPVVLGNAYEDDVTFDMSTISLMYQKSTGKRLQDFNKLSVVAMLIDNNSGTIVNAARAKVVASETDAIRHTTVNPQSPTAVYNLAGQKVSSDFRGIVIKNGKKVVK